LPIARSLGGETLLSETIGIQCKLPVDQRAALEQLLFFNVNQHRVRLGIQESIETYGVPAIHEQEGGLSVRVGDIEGVQSLFAVSDAGRPLGVAVFVRLARERFVVLHLGVQHPHALAADLNTRVLMKLMRAARTASIASSSCTRIAMPSGCTPPRSRGEPRQTPRRREASLRLVHGRSGVHRLP
jgi:hypothetical protein